MSTGFLPKALTSISCSILRKKNRSLLLLLLFSTLFLTAQKKTVVIDPGHGGHDKGAVGLRGTTEKDIVLKLSRKVDSLNKVFYPKGHEFYLTRYNDIFIPLSNRSKVVKSLDADLFLSIHCNQLQSSRSSKGTEVYVIVPKNEHPQSTIKSSILLASILEDKLSRKLHFKSRGVKFANFQVLRQTVGSCPGVLLETAFLSNDNEEDYFNNDNNLTALSMAILQSIYQYFKIAKNEK